MKLCHEAPHVSFFTLRSGQPISMGIGQRPEDAAQATGRPIEDFMLGWVQALVLLDVVVGHLELAQEASNFSQPFSSDTMRDAQN